MHSAKSKISTCSYQLGGLGNPQSPDCGSIRINIASFWGLTWYRVERMDLYQIHVIGFVFNSRHIPL